MKRYALIDCRMSDKCRHSLDDLGFITVDIPENPYLDKPVSAHPDISVFYYNNEIIAESNCTEILKKQMFETGDLDLKITVESTLIINTSYPYDCTLNFAVCGNKIIGNMKYINPCVSEIAVKYGLQPINVKQGYAKCNICVVSNNAIITEDKGIAKECSENGIDVLLLNTNAVKLSGYQYGFIGGSSGSFINDKNKNIVLFCGCIERHPEYIAIKSFCQKHGAVPISLSDDDLYDYGSVIII